MPLEFVTLLNTAWLFLRVIFCSTHPVHHYPVDLFSEIERWLVSLAEARKICREIEISGRIDIGADEFDFGWSSIVPKVSFAETVDEFVCFDSGLPALNPTLSIQKVLAPFADSSIA